MPVGTEAPPRQERAQRGIGRDDDRDDEGRLGGVRAELQELPEDDRDEREQRQGGSPDGSVISWGHSFRHRAGDANVPAR